MECKEFLELINAWEADGVFPADSLQELTNHLARCRTGCRQYALLLPFIGKDAGIRQKLLSDNIPVTGSTVNRVMAGITAQPRVKRPLHWLPAAAAIVLILIGAGFLFTSRFWLPANDEMLVHFELAAAEARTVFLVGDFTDWDPLKIPLTGPDDEGRWTVKIRLKQHKSYTYNFLIDGEIWMPDPQAEITVDDGFGGINSIINL